MDRRAAEFAAHLLAMFKVEAEEHLKEISNGLLNLEKELPEENRKEVIETIFREAHSLKGAARAVNQDSVEDICQSLENVLSDLKHEKIQLDPPLFDSLYATLDQITKSILGSSEKEKDPKDPPLNLAKEAEPAAPVKKIEEPASVQPVETPLQTEQKNTQTASPIEPLQEKTIRASAKKLDKLMQEVEETLIVKLITGQRFSNVRNFLEQFKQWEKSWNKVQKDIRQCHQAKEAGVNGYIPSKDFLEFLEQQPSLFKEMGEDLQNITKKASQDFRLVGSIVDGLLEDTKKLLMQPFASLFEIFPRMVRDIAQSLNKKANILLEGSEIEVDRRILDEMKDPLIHLIRNCIDHGLEPIEERQKKNKSTQGQIRLSARQTSGNTVEICVSDDGKGIDARQVKNAAIGLGAMKEKDFKTMTEQEVLMLIFKSGISTSPIITELSGRGLGLGIVQEKVEKLGGHISLETKVDVGTTFKIILPLTIATFRGIQVQASNYDFIIPTHNTHRVMRIVENDIHTIEGKNSINLNGRILSYVHLNDLLHLPTKSDEEKSDKYIYVIVIKAADTTIAIGVDQILNEQEVFIKSLGKQLVKVKNIAAATVMECGKVLPILDPFDLVKSVKKTSGRSHAAAPIEKDIKKNTILIAEDSVTARMLLKNILESAGYDTKTAVDGAEAFSILKTEPIDLLVSDVEMPRLDGFNLTAKIRAVEKFKDMPIILCTSRGSREDREHGIEVGANAYLDKSTFAQSNLLEIIQKLL